jgi:hypothetical protein
MNFQFQQGKYPINHVGAKTLSTGLMIPRVSDR